MILTNPAPRGAEIDDDIAMLIDRYGLRRVALRVMARLLGRRPRAVADTLPNHLRRDIGLPPDTAPRRYWDLR